MQDTPDNYTLLITKLDEFTRKFYINQLIRGLIYTGAILVALFILLNVAEYFLFLSGGMRKALLYGYLSLAGILSYLWVLSPIMHYFKLGKVISYEQAADIIGKYFSEVQDKLLNILQLKHQVNPIGDVGLITASIKQKIDNLKPIPFSSAINFGENKKHLKYLLVPVAVFFVILFASPNVIKDGTNRLINNGTSFAKPAPFSFTILNNKLTAVQGEDFEIKVKVDGNILPSMVSIKQNGFSTKMQKQSNNEFVYSFINLQANTHFVFLAEGFSSNPYEINVLQKPMIVSFEAHLDYPSYTKIEDEMLNNIGDLSVPEGTKIRWSFEAKNTESITLTLNDTLLETNRRGENQFEVNLIAKHSMGYSIKVSNKELLNADSINYALTIAPDQYPTISVKPYQDSIASKFLYFIGDISDDYGLVALNLMYKVEAKDPTSYQKISIPFNKRSKLASFNYYWTLQDLGLKPGNQLTYYFQVWDNDGVNGSKSTKSSTLQYKLPTVDELDDQTDESNKKIKDQLASSKKKADELKKDLKKMQNKLLEKKNLSWEDQQMIKDLLEKQKSLQSDIEKLKEEFANNLEKQNQFKEYNEDLVEKQKMVQELFNELMSDEMKKLFEELEKLMAEMENKEELMETLEDFEMSEDELEDELDRMLSLFKQLEFEQKMEETVDKLEKLAEDQQELSEETENKEKSDEELAIDQKEISDRFEKIEENLDELLDMNKELESEYDMSQAEEDGKEIKEQLSQSEESLEQGKNKKASESQKSAGEKMQEMAEQMSNMMESANMEQMALDLDLVRQILENLLTLSFEQENLIDEIKNTGINDPRYVALIQKQHKIKDDSKLVEDSLFALSKRVLQIESFVNKEIKAVNKNIDYSIEDLVDRHKNKASVKQQLVMTGYNNLALMLDEVMQAMQQQMASKMDGPPKMCQGNKPGGKPKPGKGKGLGQLQKELNDQIAKMKGESKKPGGKKGGMSKELAQAAAKQAAIRDAMQKMAEQESKQGGKGMGNELKEIMEEMNKTETDLVNKRLTDEMLLRQQELTTRLLEAEEAIKEREMDKERKSITGDELAREMPPSLEEYLKKRDAEIQLYKTVPPSLKPYYRSLVESYFKNISF